ncbi:hypothetical protein GQ600_5812 [Phytophthora cactorum]|nr:hypothetical protein GQ600_5812 [Phytophthora cactorum]
MTSSLGNTTLLFLSSALAKFPSARRACAFCSSAPESTSVTSDGKPPSTVGITVVCDAAERIGRPVFLVVISNAKKLDQWCNGPISANLVAVVVTTRSQIAQSVGSLLFLSVRPCSNEIHERQDSVIKLDRCSYGAVVAGEIPQSIRAPLLLSVCSSLQKLH